MESRLSAYGLECREPWAWAPGARPNRPECRRLIATW